jgi:hypothetical protein
MFSFYGLPGINFIFSLITKIYKERNYEASSYFRGISNTKIHNALVDLLGKPIAEASPIFVPTYKKAYKICILQALSLLTVKSVKLY